MMHFLLFPLIGSIVLIQSQSVLGKRNNAIHADDTFSSDQAKNANEAEYEAIVYNRAKDSKPVRVRRTPYTDNIETCKAFVWSQVKNRPGPLRWPFRCGLCNANDDSWKTKWSKERQEKWCCELREKHGPWSTQRTELPIECPYTQEEKDALEYEKTGVNMTMIRWTNLGSNVGSDGDDGYGVRKFGDFRAVNAFRRQTSSSRPAYLGGGLPKTIWYDLWKPTLIGKISFRNRRERGHTTNNPVNFEFVGAEVCGSWTVIQTFSGVRWSGNDEKKIYKIENVNLMKSNGFSCYGIRVTKISGKHGPCIQDIKMWRIDIDKCGDGSHNCHDNATCTNTDRNGNFKCECKRGHFGNGTSCQVFDKCGDGSHNCHDNATCTNTDRDGYFKCECKPGHFGNGTSCQEITDCRNKPTTDYWSTWSTCSNSTFLYYGATHMKLALRGDDGKLTGSHEWRHFCWRQCSWGSRKVCDPYYLKYYEPYGEIIKWSYDFKTKEECLKKVVQEAQCDSCY